MVQLLRYHDVSVDLLQSTAFISAVRIPVTKHAGVVVVIVFLRGKLESVGTRSKTRWNSASLRKGVLKPTSGENLRHGKPGGRNWDGPSRLRAAQIARGIYIYIYTYGVVGSK